MYFVNGYRFHTEKHGSKRATYNSGVFTTAEYGDYYGILEEIIEIEYPALPLKRCVLFKCKWFDPTMNRGTRVHEKYKSVEVLRKGRFNRFEPFILASQANQVAYVDYPSTQRSASDWIAVCKVQPRGWVNVDNSSEEQTQYLHQDPFQDENAETATIVEVARDENVALTTDGYASFGDEEDDFEFVVEEEELVLSSDDSETSLHTSDCDTSDENE